MKSPSQLFFLKNEDKHFCQGNNKTKQNMESKQTQNHNPSKFKCKYIFEQKPHNPTGRIRTIYFTGILTQF